MTRSLFFLFFSFILMSFLFGCTILEKGLEWDRSTNQVIEKKKEKKRKLYCKRPYTSKIFSTSKTGATLFEQLEGTGTFKGLNPSEKFVAAILIHFTARPEIVTATSRFQYVNLNLKTNKLSYRDFKNSKPPQFFASLRNILKRDPKRSLNSIINLIDNRLPQKISVEQELEDFLRLKKKEIKSHSPHDTIFTKADQALRVGETFTRPSLKDISKQLGGESSETKSKPLTHLFGPFYNQQAVNKQQKIHCNFDLNLYRQGIFVISPWSDQKDLTFALYDKPTQKLLWASFSVRPSKVSLHKKLPVFLSQGKNNSAKFCQIKNQSDSFFLSSTRGRDPAQHLYHLLQYQKNVDGMTPKELKTLLNFPRHLLLKSPLRLIYESERGTKDQLREFLKMNIPLYHAEKLGAMWLFHQTHQDSEKSAITTEGFILDDRWDAELKCQK